LKGAKLSVEETLSGAWLYLCLTTCCWSTRYEHGDRDHVQYSLDFFVTQPMPVSMLKSYTALARDSVAGCAD
jgi:hypothetical protein